MRKIIDARINDHIEAVKRLQAGKLPDKIEEAAHIVKKAVTKGRKVLFCGNGGSAADCQHLAAEFVGRFQKERHALPAIALTVDTSILTAVSNDYGYSTVFARQIEGLGEKGDVLVAISTSGNSESIIRAIEAARKKDMAVIGMTAEGGGKMAFLCDVLLDAPDKVTARAQEMHILMGHIICELVDE